MYTAVNVITLAVHDLDRSVRFYGEGLGCQVERRDEGGAVVRLGGPEMPRLELRPWDDLAGVVGSAPETDGFRGFMISAIFPTAQAVDNLLDAAVRAGGTLVKPGKGAAWGYAGHFADPDGHAWKAVTSGSPLLAKFKRSHPAPAAGPALAPQEVAVTLAVPDMKAAKHFYTAGLGYEVDKAFGKFAKFKPTPGAATLSLYTRDALATDAGVDAAGHGFRGYALTFQAPTEAGVDAVTLASTTAGARVVSGPATRPGSGYSTVFLAPDEAAWSAALTV
ncbi:Glyoxalase/bleomycin resistance protein/dioxygenase [Catenulispora acidiphila DSM 44928]|uniref:Glyoxalase/bleomycin resistance protein/dioxygenase n=1 Tax=Catenulispora acidiphila (strain DSM 44928 / JCM 14897 / NBRC 102108 / NRRL B-24433 / ID139908) TaxID=479433 RepID=C7Q6B5_CATAD|nr:VOC family protein [Catenulispora acidiphila]ACU72121.1 Glyoxalase/bleomycin resistance protein/dioxygenase [Catenulispora acidiphila DSM 44928]